MIDLYRSKQLWTRKATFFELDKSPGSSKALWIAEPIVAIMVLLDGGLFCLHGRGQE